MDTQNSQKKSRRGSATTSERNRVDMGRQGPPRRPPADDEQFMDYSMDHVARVRAAKEAAQREMESFGDPSEYDVVILQGQLKEEPPTAPSQGSLDFQNTAPEGPGEPD